MPIAVHRWGGGGAKKGICIHGSQYIFTHRQYILIYFTIFIINNRMKRIILILTAIFLLSSCLSYQVVPTNYRSLSPFYPYLYDPIYDFYPNPYLYRQYPRTIIINPAPTPPRVYTPRQYNLMPGKPQPRPGQAPVRTFPKKDDKK